MRAFALKSGVIVTVQKPMRSKTKVKGSFSQSLEIAKAGDERHGVTYSKRRKNIERFGNASPFAWRIEKNPKGSWSWKNDFHLSDCELFKGWVEKSVARLPPDVQIIEEKNSFISLSWLETFPESEKQIIDFLDECANFKFD